MPRTESRNVISAFPTDGNMLWLGMWIMKESTDVNDAVKRLKAMEAGLAAERVRDKSRDAVPQGT